MMSGLFALVRVVMDLQQTIRDAKPGSSLSLPAGRYVGPFFIDKPLTLMAMGQVVLDGQHAESVIRIETQGLVRLSGLMIVGGNAPEAGGGINLVTGDLELSDSTLRFNKAPLHGGGGLYVAAGKVKVSRCRFEANTGRQGAAVLIDGDAEVRIEDSAILQNAAVWGGGVLVKEGAKVELVGCTLADNKVVGEGAQGGALHVSGTTTREPVVTVRQSIVSERAEVPAALIFQSGRHGGTVKIERSLVSPWAKRAAGPDNTFGDAGFLMAGSDPYVLNEKSVAVGALDASAIEPGRKDVNGKPRVNKGRADLGAFAFNGGGGGSIGY